MNAQTFVLPADNRSQMLPRVVAFLESALPGKRLKITVEQERKRRSDQQNRYLWGVVYRAFMEVLEGWDAEDVHEYLLGEHFGWETIEGMGRRRLKPIRRSSKLNKLEFAQYVDYCIRKGAEHGVFVPEPDFEWSAA